VHVEFMIVGRKKPGGWKGPMYTLFTIAVSGKKPSLTDLLLTHKSQGHI
jgi:hypothetical protein